jgi:hypothetical protein
MSEQAPVPVNNPEFKEHHPNAVGDTVKAEFMAQMMDPHETKAVELRAELREAALKAADVTDSYHHGKPLVEMGTSARAGNLTRDIQDQLDLSDRKADDAANIHDAIEGTKR